MRGAGRPRSGRRSVPAHAEGKGGRGARPVRTEAAVWGRTGLPALGPLLPAWRSVRGAVNNPEERPCSSKGTLLDVIVAAATIFFPALLRQFVLPERFAVTGVCVARRGS